MTVERQYSRRYTLLRQERLRPRPLTFWYKSTDQVNVETFLSHFRDDQDLFFDIETTGLDPTDKDLLIVGLGVACDSGTYYADLRHWSWSDWRYFFGLIKGKRTYAFNAPFDMSWLYRYNGYQHVGLAGCTLNLFKLLANEGWTGQSHRLEVLQDEILGWPVSQKATLEELLLRHGITKGNGSSPDKSRMYTLADLEPAAFAEYCAMDAEAARQGWQVLVRQADALGLSGTLQYAREEWPNEIELIIEGQHAGIAMDRDRLGEIHSDLTLEKGRTEGRLRKDPRLRKGIAEREKQLLRSKAYVSVRSRRERAKATDSPSPEDGWFFEPSEAKSLSASEREEGGYWYRNTYTYSIAGWPHGEHDAPPTFNFGSDHDMRWLLYEYLYSWEKGKDGVGRDTAVVDLGERKVEVLLTDGGSPPVGKEILPALGEIGQTLTSLSKLEKRDEYVRSYLAGSERTGRVHPSFKAPGTITGRLSGGKD